MVSETERRSKYLAPMLLAPFRKRFIDAGNVYDMEKKANFTPEEREGLKKQHNLTTDQCTSFARNVYVCHPGEKAFRDYIGVHLPCEDVSIFCILFCLMSLRAA